MGQKPKAIESYSRAAELFQKVGDRFGEASTLRNIGNLYNDLGDKTKAKEFFDRADAILSKIR
jgi:tetratricopeptide (TPR) repeat protein